MLVLAWIGLITVSLVVGWLAAWAVGESLDSDPLAALVFGPVVLITGYLLWVNVLRGGV